MVLLYSILTEKTIDVGQIILGEMWNYAARHSGPAYFLFTITILCLKAKILANVKKAVEESEDPEEEEEEDPTEIEPMQSAKIPDKAELMEPVTEPDVATSMFRTQSPCPNLQDEMSKLMDIMQHMQWKQQAYWGYSKLQDDSMRSTLMKIFNDPFIFVPKFLDFIFESWSPLSKRQGSNSCKNKDDGAKDESNLEGSVNN
ncbi:hypothetical protein J1N35_043932 [Gossypium stocksii]|uniref:Uncharacterized protein n=1 Tax=Gossypium stocksii TaxID=47602 RepID=A0A9D3U8J8_9ROSI|nr:hypothetical protein J1N35_043932 [Gossypium stocksii]